MPDSTLNPNQPMPYMIVITGDEILAGKRSDKHVAFITQQLNPLGMICEQVYMVGDKYQHLTAALREAIQHVPITIVTGGLGPTLDDITRDAISEATNIPLKEDPEALKFIGAFFQRINRPMSDNNKRQALVPIRGFYFENFNGTAPGLLFDMDKKVMVALPGPPRELEPMLVNQVIPYLKKRFSLHHTTYSRYFHFSSLGESNIDQVLRNVLPKDPGLDISSIATPGMVDITLNYTGDEKPSNEKLDQFAASLRKELGPYIYSEQADDSLEEVVGNLLKERKQTVAVAESCTGGLLSSKITAIAGSSDYYVGGIISYSNEVKINQLGVKPETIQQFGAVSKETVCEMAKGICEKLHSTWGLAVTGVAGPGGGTEEKPVGTVWLAACKEGKEIYPFKMNMFGDRAGVQLRSAISALDQLRRILSKLPIYT